MRRTPESARDRFGRRRIPRRLTRVYRSTTDATQTMEQPPIGAPSSLCLSCHDGTVAPGQTVPYGKIQMQGKMSASDILGTSLQNSHPFSFNKLKDQADLVASLISKGQTQDPLQKVTLINGNVECESCHNPHVQNGDAVSLNFLVRNSAGGAMCLSCHGTSPRTVNSKPNPLVPWPTSAHATISNAILPAAECRTLWHRCGRTHARVVMWSTMQMAQRDCCAARRHRSLIWTLTPRTA